MYLARFILIGSALLLPTLSLLPLGALYLWEKKYLLWWALASLVSVLIISLLQRMMFGSALPKPSASATAETPPDPKWNPLEEKAWSDVRDIAKRANLDQISDPQAFVDLGLQTVDAVARRLHPEKPDALWRFTLPEALAISERVSQQLSRSISTHVPFADRMTMAQFWAIYRWRRGFEFAEKAYDVWRILRLANPATAVTNEARDRLSKALVQWGRDHVSRRISETFVEEVGRAAIDLYGGRLKLPTPSTAADTQAAPAGSLPKDMPIAFLAIVGGSTLAAQEAIADALTHAQREFSSSQADSEEFKHHFSVAEFRSLDDARQDTSLKQLLAADILVWLVDGDPKPDDIAYFSAANAYFEVQRDERPPALLRVTMAGRSPVTIEANSDPLISISFANALARDITIPLLPGRAPGKEQAHALSVAIHELFPSATRVYNARVIKQLKTQPRRWQSSKQAVSALFKLGRAVSKRVVKRE